MKRRTFVKTAMATTPALITPLQRPLHSPVIDTSLKVLVFNTNWGFQGSVELFCEKTKAAGFDGIEVWWPKDDAARKALFDALQKYELEVGFLVGGHESDPQQHFQSFKASLDGAANSSVQKPVYINCHSGRDYFSFQDNSLFIEYTSEVASKSNIEILHETHRGRMCFAAHITKGFLDKYQEMRLTLDISHWVNVHESLLEGMTEIVDAALQRVGHIHARVGHQEGPQVNDPRAPEWKNVLDLHLAWWDQCLKYREKSGAKQITFLTEFGPPTYLPSLPYTRQPVADQWAINVFMKDLIRQRYQ